MKQYIKNLLLDFTLNEVLMIAVIRLAVVAHMIF